MKTTLVSVTLKLDPALLAAVNEWRRKKPNIPNRSDAIRELIEKGLGKSEKRA